RSLESAAKSPSPVLIRPQLLPSKKSMVSIEELHATATVTETDGCDNGPDLTAISRNLGFASRRRWRRCEWERRGSGGCENRP
ncbi:hypothetical protein U1Q18_036265, partial [Sarracenia purpurea var. burkii]